jgi:hypothetical protein
MIDRIDEYPHPSVVHYAYGPFDMAPKPYWLKRLGGIRYSRQGQRWVGEYEVTPGHPPLQTAEERRNSAAELRWPHTIYVSMDERSALLTSFGYAESPVTRQEYVFGVPLAVHP